MLNTLTSPPAGGTPRARQTGVVLMMALIVLVAMTLAGIALVRSVDTTNIIAGNLAFKQAATNSADTATATAVTWLQKYNSGTTLFHDILAQGYEASIQPLLTTGQTWDNYWNTVLKPAGQVVTLPQDAAGNTVSYAIQRLCNQQGDPVSPGPPPTACAVPQSVAVAGSSSRTAGTVALLYNSQIFYRITAQVAGPRGAVSYIQTIVAL